jgi:uncharacterized phage protein (TIGR01671 family)
MMANSRFKFRAWDKTENKMFIPEHFGFSESELITIDGGSIVPYGSYELMQFTGLHDKNGKEIYEGDILTNFYGEGEVSFYNGRFIFESEHIRDGLWFIAEHGQVIGNIYEHPHLLET